MVSSELVVLLIVCVGINTGSTQGFCRGTDGTDDSACLYESTDNTSSCVNTTLQCENKECRAVISGVSRICGFQNIGAGTVSQPIQCCFCNISSGIIQLQQWDCENVTTPIPTPTPSLPSSTTDTALSSVITTTTTIPITTVSTAANNAATSTVTMVTSQPSLMDSMITIIMTTTSITTPTIVSMTTTTISTTPTATPMATSNIAIPVVSVVVVLVVCLLVVGAIATIIILYKRTKLQKDTNYQKTLHQLDNTIYGTDEATHEDPNASMKYYEIPDTANQKAPPIYSAVGEEETPTNNIDNQQAPPIYSAVGEEETPTNNIDNQQAPPIYSAIGEEETPTNNTNGIDNPCYEYSTVDDKRDTSNEGLVYSAVVVKDGKKTTVKTMATPQDEDTEQTPDTVQPVDVIDGMVYSAVIRQDGKKTSVKITVE